MSSAVTNRFPLLALLVLSACFLEPAVIPLDQTFRLEMPARQNCQPEYTLVLDEASASYQLTTHPDNVEWSSMTWTFEIGQTVSRYLSQAQNAQTTNLIPLNFYLSEFTYSMDSGIVKPPVVGTVSFQAHFEGPDPIGKMTFQEQGGASKPRLWNENHGDLPTHEDPQAFFAISEALQRATQQALIEADYRLCRQ